MGGGWINFSWEDINKHLFTPDKATVRDQRKASNVESNRSDRNIDNLEVVKLTRKRCAQQ